MEYLDGVSLDYLIENMPTLPLSRVLDVLIQVACGLKYAHSKGIVHQDIKPANIFLLDGDRARIVDFGLAIPIGSIDDTGFGGTPFYMAPEQIECDEIDESTDIYSFGIMAYEMATGLRPFPQKNIAEVFRSHKEEPVPDPTAVNGSLPPEFNTFVQRCTQKTPSNRYRNFEETVKDLRNIASLIGLRDRPSNFSPSKAMSILMTFSDDNQVEVANLVDCFVGDLKTLGAIVRIGDFHDV